MDACFNPCCVGLFKRTQYPNHSFQDTDLVSILVVLDYLKEPGKRTGGRDSIFMFQSLLCWII